MNFYIFFSVERKEATSISVKLWSNELKIGRPIVERGNSFYFLCGIQNFDSYNITGKINKLYNYMKKAISSGSSRFSLLPLILTFSCLI